VIRVRYGYMMSMSTSPLKHDSPRPPDGMEATRLEQFATAMALRDRSRHRSWLRDGDVERAIRGYAYAAAIAEHRSLTITGDDLDGAISAYRRARRFPVQRSEPAQRSLIAFAGGTAARESRESNED
jgi:hypothetical protein